MDRPLSLKQCTSTFEIAVSLETLLKQGCCYIQQGYYTEGATLLSIVRTQLAAPGISDQASLVGVLDAFLQEYACYQRSRQALQEASIRFAEVQKEQKEYIAVLSSTLLTLVANAHMQQAYDVSHTDLVQPVPNADAPYSLYITCFGQFEVKLLGKSMLLCPSRNGQGILRYLVAQAGHHAKSDTLQTLFWPDDEPEVAQRKLHVAISSLRRSLSQHLAMKSTVVHEHDIILHKNRVYSLNPAIAIRTDADDFLHYYHMGQQENQNEQQKIAYYEQACQLYIGPYLSEDLYADWSFLQREQLSQAYIVMCNILADYYLQHKQFEGAARWATAILQENRCDEAAHCQLIQIYIAQGKRSEAYQQYQRCESIMREELGVGLLPETVHMFRQHFTDGFSQIKPK